MRQMMSEKIWARHIKFRASRAHCRRRDGENGADSMPSFIYTAQCIRVARVTMANAKVATQQPRAAQRLFASTPDRDPEFGDRPIGIPILAIGTDRVRSGSRFWRRTPILAISSWNLRIDI